MSQAADVLRSCPIPNVECSTCCTLPRLGELISSLNKHIGIGRFRTRNGSVSYLHASTYSTEYAVVPFSGRRHRFPIYGKCLLEGTLAWSTGRYEKYRVAGEACKRTGARPNPALFVVGDAKHTIHRNTFGPWRRMNHNTKHLAALIKFKTWSWNICWCFARGRTMVGHIHQVV